MTGEGRQRIDKWLWYARLAKSRTLAQKLATSGRVRINRVKNESASQLVKSGDTLTITLEANVRVLRVVAPGTRRGPPAEAATLFEDLSPPAPPRARTIVSSEPDAGARPTKRDRRARLALKRSGEEDFPETGD
jgi:ribosome-associated heat shock protein Hsp15